MTRKRKHPKCKAGAMRKHPRIPQPENLPPQDAAEVTQLFNKTFRYKSVSNPAPLRNPEHTACAEAKNSGKCGSVLQDTMVEDWFGACPKMAPQGYPNDPDLMTLKAEVNKVKDQLSNKDIQTWHGHTTRCNLAASIIPHVKSLDVELCTQAWVKFYEILCAHHQAGLVPDHHFLSLHLCEAPGAFVTALNHFLQHNGFPHMWDWRATTLNPYHESNSLGEMIADDRLIRQTYTQWYFGADGSGDITLPGHVSGLCKLMARIAQEQEMELFLVTADGSKDCQEKPGEQESLVSRLHYCEALTAALVLSKGGALVIKLFTMLERSSVLLAFLLNIMFEQVHAMKPANSKSGNSEIYLVCLGYRKNVQHHTLWKLLDITVYKNKEGQSLDLLKPLPPDFLEEHKLCCKMFAQWQLETISTNLRLFENMSEEQELRLAAKQRVALTYFLQRSQLGARGRYFRRVAGFCKDRSAFYFPPTPVGAAPHQSNTTTSSDAAEAAVTSPSLLWQHKPQQRQCGTFHLRQMVSSLPWSQRLAMIERRDASQPRATQIQCRHPIEEEELDDLTETVCAEPFNVVRTSRLCDPGLLADFNLLLENSHYEDCRQAATMEHAQWLGRTAAHLMLKHCSQISVEKHLGTDHQLAHDCQNLQQLPQIQKLQQHLHQPQLPRHQQPQQLQLQLHPQQLQPYQQHILQQLQQLQQQQPQQLQQQLQIETQQQQLQQPEQLQQQPQHIQPQQLQIEAQQQQIETSHSLPQCPQAVPSQPTLSSPLSSDAPLPTSVSPSSIPHVLFYWDTPHTNNNVFKALEKEIFDLHGDNVEVKVIDQCHGDTTSKASDLDPGTLLRERLLSEGFSSTPVTIFCNVTSFGDSHFHPSWDSNYEELRCRAKFGSIVAGLLTSIAVGSSVVLLTPTFLTRLSASLLYGMARLFNSTEIESAPSLWQHQLVKLENYKGAVPGLVSHLSDAALTLSNEARLSQRSGCLMEVLSFPTIMSDRKFVQFVTAHNNRNLAGFVNLMLDQEAKSSHSKSSLPKTSQSKKALPKTSLPKSSPLESSLSK